jgi:hypothetical protein
MSSPGRDLGSVVVSWESVQEKFISQAHAVFSDGTRKAFFDSSPFDIKIIEKNTVLTAEERKQKKREKQIEGGKSRWYPLLMLDSVVLHIERVSSQQPHKLQQEYALYKDLKATEPIGQEIPTSEQSDDLIFSAYEAMPRRRSFNQHLALQISVWNVYIDSLREQYGTGPQKELTLVDLNRPILIENITESGWASPQMVDKQLRSKFCGRIYDTSCVLQQDRASPTSVVGASQFTPDSTRANTPDKVSTSVESIPITSTLVDILPVVSEGPISTDILHVNCSKRELGKLVEDPAVLASTMSATSSVSPRLILGRDGRSADSRWNNKLILLTNAINGELSVLVANLVLEICHAVKRDFPFKTTAFLLQHNGKGPKSSKKQLKRISLNSDPSQYYAHDLDDVSYTTGANVATAASSRLTRGAKRDRIVFESTPSFEETMVPHSSVFNTTPTLYLQKPIDESTSALSTSSPFGSHLDSDDRLPTKRSRSNAMIPAVDMDDIVIHNEEQFFATVLAGMSLDSRDWMEDGDKSFLNSGNFSSIWSSGESSALNSALNDSIYLSDDLAMGSPRYLPLSFDSPRPQAYHAPSPLKPSIECQSPPIMFKVPQMRNDNIGSIDSSFVTNPRSGFTSPQVFTRKTKKYTR